MDGDAVSVVTLEPQLMAAVRRHVRFAELPSQIRGFYDLIYAAVPTGRFAKTGRNVALYRNIRNGAADAEFGVPVAARFADFDEIECREIPGGEYASTTHWGAYADLGRAYDRLFAWIPANGRREAGVHWEYYGNWNDDITKVRTDLHILLRPR